MFEVFFLGTQLNMTDASVRKILMGEKTWCENPYVDAISTLWSLQPFEHIKTNASGAHMNRLKHVWSKFIVFKELPPEIEGAILLDTDLQVHHSLRSFFSGLDSRGIETLPKPLKT